jgi:hypothetical protein
MKSWFSPRQTSNVPNLGVQSCQLAVNKQIRIYRVWSRNGGDITGGCKKGSVHEGDSVWCMHECTHPHFPSCEIINVYAAVTGVTCVEAASLLGMSEVGMTLT